MQTLKRGAGLGCLAIVLLCSAGSRSAAQPAPINFPASCTSSSTSLCTVWLDVGDPTGDPARPQLTSRDCESESGFPSLAPPLTDPGGTTHCRVAVVWPGDGSEPKPPLILYNQGSGGGNALSSSAHATYALHTADGYPGAVVVYAQPTDKVGHDSRRPSVSTANASTALHRDWAPRFASQVSTAQHLDLSYIDALLVKVGGLFDYQRGSVYVNGHSSGCFFTMALLELRPDTFKGFSGGGCRPAFTTTGLVSNPKPVLYFMGDQDSVSGIGQWTPLDPSFPRARVGSGVDNALNALTTRSGARQRTPLELSSYGVTLLPAELEGGVDVEWGQYNGGHSWSPSERPWIIGFVRRWHRAHYEVGEVDRDVYDKGWPVSSLTLPILD